MGNGYSKPYEGALTGGGGKETMFPQSPYFLCGFLSSELMGVAQ